MSIQQDVMHAIGSTALPRRELRAKVGGYTESELDIAVNALNRAKRLTLVNGMLMTISSSRPLGDMPHTGRPAKAAEGIPTAAEEAAASLSPRTGLVVERICNECRTPKPIGEFRLLNADSGRRAKTCDSCHGLKKLQRHEKACQSGPEPGGPNEVLPSSDRTVSSPVESSAVHFNDTAGRESEPEKGHRQSSAPAPGKAAPEQTLTVHVDLAPLIRQRRQDIAKQIELARVALDNLVNKQLEYDRFLELHERLASEVAA